MKACGTCRILLFKSIHLFDTLFLFRYRQPMIVWLHCNSCRVHYTENVIYVYIFNGYMNDKCLFSAWDIVVIRSISRYTIANILKNELYWNLYIKLYSWSIKIIGAWIQVPFRNYRNSCTAFNSRNCNTGWLDYRVNCIMRLAILYVAPGMETARKVAFGEEDNVESSHSYHLLRLPVTFPSVRKAAPSLGIPNVPSSMTNLISW
jgi:hypothetical protein